LLGVQKKLTRNRAKGREGRGNSEESKDKEGAHLSLLLRLFGDN
jgi:hypothetical protein